MKYECYSTVLILLVWQLISSTYEYRSKGLQRTKHKKSYATEAALHNLKCLPLATKTSNRLIKSTKSTNSINRNHISKANRIKPKKHIRSDIRTEGKVNKHTHVLTRLNLKFYHLIRRQNEETEKKIDSKRRNHTNYFHRKRNTKHKQKIKHLMNRERRKKKMLQRSNTTDTSNRPTRPPPETTIYPTESSIPTRPLPTPPNEWDTVNYGTGSTVDMSNFSSSEETTTNIPYIYRQRFNKFLKDNKLLLPFELDGTLVQNLKDMKNCVCPRVYYPVCATDGKTYANACIFNCMQTLGALSKVTIRRPGYCLNFRRG